MVEFEVPKDGVDTLQQKDIVTPSVYYLAPNGEDCERVEYDDLPLPAGTLANVTIGMDVADRTVTIGNEETTPTFDETAPGRGLMSAYSFNSDSR